MKKGVSLTTALVMLSSMVYGGGNDATALVEPEPIQIVKENFFIYGGGGIAGADVSSLIMPDVKVLPGILDDSGSVWEAGVGYRYTKDVFTTVSLQGIYLDQVDILNASASINYRFSDLIVMPYFGAVLGYSNLEYQEIPVDTTGHTNVDAKLDADHVAFGLQAGAEYELTDQFTLFGKYQFMNYGHKMEIFQTSDIEHSNTQNLEGGIRYEF